MTLNPFKALAGKVDHAVETKIITSVVRHAASFLGGLLVAHGLIMGSQAQDVEGGIATLLAVGAGVLQKVLEANAQ